ncbi:MAG: TolC family protein [Lentimicrobium sp.]
MSTAVYPQEGSLFDPLKDDISSSIPPLEVLIDSAISNNPQIHYRDQQININEFKLRSKRVEWTRNIGIQANTGYGNLYNYSSTSTGAIDPAPIASVRSQTQYSALFYINFPISTIVDRNNQIRLAKSEISQAQEMVLQQQNELRQIVILQLNDLILNQRLLVLRSKKLESVKANMQMGETQFVNGVIPLSEYTQLSAGVSDAEIDFEKARMDFLDSYMILEEIVGFKFNLFKTSQGNDEHN